MARGIAFQVAVRLVIADDLVQDHQDVGLDAGVGVFVDGQRGGGVRHEQITEAFPNPTFPDRGLDLASQVQ